jgi:hypothetical protein
MSDRQYFHRKPPKDEDRPSRAKHASEPEAPPATSQPETGQGGPRAAAPPARAARAGPTGPAKRERFIHPVHAVVLGFIVSLALYLRFLDPLTSSVIGAEDPYLHMERTWDLVQGKGVHDYPIGFAILMAPFAILGTDGFYTAARFLPPFLGAASVAGVFFLCRRFVHPAGALTAALLTAVIPEHISRTSLLFPTALDLAVLPFLMLAVFHAMDGSQRAMYWAGGLTFLLFIVHPWVVALMMPPIAVFFVVMGLKPDATFRPEARRWATRMGGGSLGMFLIVLLILQGGQAFGRILGNALPQLVGILGGSMPAKPDYVDLPYMVTVPVILLAGIGGVSACVRRTRLGLFALVWTPLLLPLTLVDWLGMSFLPHRTVAYLAIGLVLLAALPVAELARMIEQSKSKTPMAAVLGILAVLLVITLPAAMASPTWYRLYDEQDFEGYEELDARDTEYVMAGSWQARTGYRSITARDADYHPEFFRDERYRGLKVDEHPDIVVVVDQYTAEEGLPTEFLSEWRLIGEWGDTKAYTPA